jgi:hypothetical protein
MRERLVNGVYSLKGNCINNGSKQKARPKGVNLKVH